MIGKRSNRIFAELAAKGGKPDQLMIDATQRGAGGFGSTGGHARL